MEDSIYRLRYRDVLTVCVLSLLCLGVIMVQSAAMHVTGEVNWSLNVRGRQQLIFAIFAFATFLLVGHVDYRGLASKSLWKSPIAWLTALAAFTCLVVLIPHVGLEINGARRWLKVGPIQLQPSELGKWSVVLFLAWWLAQRPVDLSKFRGFLLTILPVGAIALLIVIQDFGTAALIMLCAVAMCLVGRIKFWHLLLVIPPAVLAGVWFIAHKSYRMHRLTAFIDPYATPQREGYHLIQSLLSFASGGVYGRGLGNGIQKLGYLPEDTTDFIFSVICEELGLFGALLTVALYLGIIYVAWQAIKEKADNFGRLLAFGVGSMIGFQAMINIAVATVSVPTKGMSLPLVSAGGTGLIITCGALGILYSVSRFDHPVEQASAPATDPTTHETQLAPAAIPALNITPSTSQ